MRWRLGIVLAAASVAVLADAQAPQRATPRTELMLLTGAGTGTYYQLGRAYQALGRAQDAETAFARAQELAHEGRELPAGLVEPRPDSR